VRSWLAAIPDDETWCRWNRSVLMGCALRAASGGGPWGLELTHAWAAQWSASHSDELAGEGWASSKQSLVGARRDCNRRPFWHGLRWRFPTHWGRTRSADPGPQSRVGARRSHSGRSIAIPAVAA
jgi:hypothetical protein